MQKFRTLKDAEASGWKLQCDDGRWIAWIPNDPDYGYVDVLSEEEAWLIGRLEMIAGNAKPTSNATVQRMGKIAAHAIDTFLNQSKEPLP